MANTKASWFLSFLSGQIKEDGLKDKEIFDQLKLVEFEVDDAEDLMQKKTIIDTYRTNDDKFDEKTFRKEYNKTLELHKQFELEKTSERANSFLLPLIGLDEQNTYEIPKFQQGGNVNIPAATQKDLQRYSRLGIEQGLRDDHIYAPEISKKLSDNPYIVGSTNYEDIYTPEQLAEHFNDYSFDAEGNRIEKQTSSFWQPLAVAQEASGKYVTMLPKDSQGNTLNINESLVKGFADLNKNATKQSNELAVVGKIGLFGAQEKERDMNISNFAKQALAAGSVDLLTGVLGGASDLLRNMNINVLDDIDNAFDSAGSRLSQQSETGENFDKRWWYDVTSMGMGQLLGIYATGGLSSAFGASANTIGKITNYSFSLYGMNSIGDELRKAGYDSKQVAIGQLATLALLTRTNKASEWITKGLSIDESKLLLEQAIKDNTSVVASKLSKEAAYTGIKSTVEKVTKSFQEKAKDLISIKGIKKGLENKIVNASKEEFVQESMEGFVPAFVLESQEALNKLANDLGISDKVNVNNKYKNQDQNYLVNLLQAAGKSVPEGVAGGVTGAGAKLLTIGFDKKAKKNKEVKYLDYLTLNGTDFNQDNIEKRYNTFVEEAKAIKDREGFFSSNLAITDDYRIKSITTKDKKDPKIIDINSLVHDTVIKDITNSYNYFNFIFDKGTKDIGYQNIQNEFDKFAELNKINNKDFNNYKLDFLKSKLVSDANTSALADVLFFSNNTEYSNQKGKTKKNVGFSEGLVSLVYQKDKIIGKLEGNISQPDILSAIRDRNTKALDNTKLSDNDFISGLSEKDKLNSQNDLAKLVGGELTQKAEEATKLTTEENSLYKELGQKLRSKKIDAKGLAIYNKLKNKKTGKAFKDRIIEIKKDKSIDAKIEKQKELLEEVLNGKFNHEFLAKTNFKLQVNKDSLNKQSNNWVKPSKLFGNSSNDWDNFLNLNETSTDAIQEQQVETLKLAETKLKDLTNRVAGFDVDTFPKKEDISIIRESVNQEKLALENRVLELKIKILESNEPDEIDELEEKQREIENNIEGLSNVEEELNLIENYYSESEKLQGNRAYFNRVIVTNKGKANQTINASNQSILEKLNEILTKAYKIPANITFDNLNDDLVKYLASHGNKLDSNWNDDSLSDLINEMEIRKAQVELNNGANVKSVQYNSVFKPVLDALGKSSIEDWQSNVIPVAESVDVNTVTEYNPLGLHTLSDEEAELISKDLDIIIYQLKTLKQISDNNSPDFEIIRLRDDILEIKEDLKDTIEILESIGINNSVDSEEYKLFNEIKYEYENNFNSLLDVNNLPVSGVNDSALLNSHELISKAYQLIYNKEKRAEEENLLSDTKINLVDSIRNSDIEKENKLKNLYVSVSSVSQLKYQNALKNYISINKSLKKVPSYIQAKYIRLYVGALLRKEVLDTPYEKAIDGSVFIKGIQGSGKTEIVLKQVTSIFSFLNKEKQGVNLEDESFAKILNDDVIVASVSASQADALKDIIGLQAAIISNLNIQGDQSYYDVFIEELEKDSLGDQVFKNKLIVIDEATLLTDSNLEKLQRLQKLFNLKIIFAGDNSQIGSGEGFNSKIDFDLAADDFKKIQKTVGSGKIIPINLENYEVNKDIYTSFTIGELRTTRRTGNKAISNFINHFREGKKENGVSKGFTTSEDLFFVSDFAIIKAENNDTVNIEGVETYNAGIEQDERWFAKIEERLNDIKVITKGTIPIEKLLIIVSSSSQLEKYKARFANTSPNIENNIMLDVQAQGRKADYIITDTIFPDLALEDAGFNSFEINTGAKLSPEEQGFRSIDSINYKLRKAVVSTVGRAVKYAMVRVNSDQITSKVNRTLNYKIETTPNAARLAVYKANYNVTLNEEGNNYIRPVTENTSDILAESKNIEPSLWDDFGINKDKFREKLEVLTGRTLEQLEKEQEILSKDKLNKAIVLIDNEGEKVNTIFSANDASGLSKVGLDLGDIYIGKVIIPNSDIQEDSIIFVPRINDTLEYYNNLDKMSNNTIYMDSNGDRYTIDNNTSNIEEVFKQCPF